jgi:hypothetical protein
LLHAYQSIALQASSHVFGGGEGVFYRIGERCISEKKGMKSFAFRSLILTFATRNQEHKPL